MDLVWIDFVKNMWEFNPSFQDGAGTEPEGTETGTGTVGTVFRIQSRNRNHASHLKLYRNASEPLSPGEPLEPKTQNNSNRSMREP